MANILVAYDGSEPAKKAVHKAAELVGEGRIFIAGIQPTAKFEEFSNIDMGESLSRLQAVVDKIVDELVSIGVNAEGIVREGDPVEELLSIADERECTLILIGKTEITRTGRFQIGDIAEQLRRRAKVPLMIVS